MASEIYRKNRPWLLAGIKEHLPEVISHLYDEGILSSVDRDGITRVSEQAIRLMDLIHKKINHNFTPFDFAVRFARVLEKANVSSSHLAEFIRELEERKITVVSRKSSLDSNIMAGASSMERQSKTLHKSHSAGSVVQQQVSDRGRIRSESSSSAISESSSRKSSSASDSAPSHRPGSAGSDSGLDQSRDSNRGRASSTARQQSSTLGPIEEQGPSEVNTVNESESEGNICASVQETIPADMFESAPTLEEEYTETREADTFLSSPRDCSEPTPTREEMSVRKQSTSQLDHFMDTVLKAAQKLLREDSEAATKEFHEMNQLYRERISELEQQITGTEEAKKLQVQEKILEREEQLAAEKKEREIQKMRVELEEMRIKLEKTEGEVARVLHQFSIQLGRKKLASLRELLELLEKANDPGSVKSDIAQKINTLKRPSTSPSNVHY